MLIEIEKVKVGERVRKDLGEIDELAEDIKDNGLINPPVVTPDYELIAGERRLEAMRKLGYRQIEVRVMKVEDAEHMLNLEINENENRKDFTKSERIEYARQLERIERAKARKREQAGVAPDPRENFPQGRTRDLVAEKLGIGSGKQYEKEKYIADNADPETLKAWDKEEISTHKAYERVRELEKELEEKEDINQMLVRSLEEERSRPSEVVEKEVVPHDYDFIKERNEALHQDLARLGEELKEARKGIRSKEEVWKEEYRKNLEKLGDNSEVEEKLKKDIEGFAWSINGFLRSLGGLIYLTEYADQVSPYSKNLFESTIQTLYEWSCQLKHNYEEHNGEIKKK